MDSQNGDITQIKKMEKIASILKQKKNLTVINNNAGKGGFGEVVIAQDQKGDQYAIKIISIFDGIDSVCDQKLINAEKEAKILSSCNHPNIVKYIDEFQIGTNYFIQMEKCEISLQDFIDKNLHKSIDEQQYVNYALQILHAIQYLHQQNYVLRDISLKNILLDSNNQIKLCDFGLAKQINPIQASQAFLTSQVKGVFFYFPPEVLEQSKQNINEQKYYQTIQGDIWAFGICIYILAGASYYHVLQFTQGLESYQTQKSISIKINEALHNILQRNPNSRPPILKIIETFKNFNSNQSDLNDLNYLNYFNDLPDNLSYLNDLNDLPDLPELPELPDLPENLSDFSDLSDPSKNEILEIEVNHNLEGNAYLNKQMYDLAIDSYKKAIQINPNHLQAYNGLGNAYYYKKLYDLAIDYYKKAMQINPNHYHSYYGLGNAYFKKQMYDLSIDSYKKALQFNPNYTQANYELGMVYTKKQMYDLAIDSYKKALKINPNHPLAHNDLGNAYFFKKLYDLAIDSYKKALQINPNLHQAHYGLGNTYDIKQMYDLAIDSFKKALQIYPNHPQANHDLGMVYTRKENYDFAIDSFKKNLKINPNNDITYNQLGNAYFYKQKYQLAIDSYKKALQLNPNHPHALNSLKLAQQKIKI